MESHSKKAAISWNALRDKIVTAYYPALLVERELGMAARRRFHSIVSIITAFFGLCAIIFAGNVILSGTTPSAAGTITSAARILDSRFIGLFLLALIVWTMSACLRAMRYYYASLGSEFELAQIMYRSSPADPLAGFLRSSAGRQICARAGAFASDIEIFLANRPAIVPADAITIAGLQTGTAVTLADYGAAFFDADRHFSHFLLSFRLNRSELMEICRWVSSVHAERLARQRWWSRQRLGRIRGIGKTWAYGRLFELEKYERHLPPPARRMDTPNAPGAKELIELEAVLVRNRRPNCFLVGDDLDEKLDIISNLARMIEQGSIMPQLEHKHLVVIDADLVISATSSMADFEKLVRTLANEAARAGNTILVFTDFPAFMNAARAHGLDAASLLDPFFTAAELQIVALSAVGPYHQLIESNPALIERFDTIELESVGDAATIRILQDELPAVEHRYTVFFTYQALAGLVTGADRYIVSGVQPEKSLGLLNELAPKMAPKTKRDFWHRHIPPAVVRITDVDDFLHGKTGIPMGQIDEGERARLLNLEKILHQRIIGQDEAVNAIAAAVRRARSGINNPARPLASFLFLGPTGVGKTETTKALADVFFGQGAADGANGAGEKGEATIERLDMSEYSGADALEKLIGEHAGPAGILANMVREHPYGVLLLDEFEKTRPEVMNLFLQILDEGFFSDGKGAKVNCRNLLIIATSNAGAELIWDAVKRGDDLSHSRELIINDLVHSGMFRPELLNRFDGLIIFHPLAREHLEKVARLQLEKLAARLASRGINLAITDDLIQYVMKSGMDPKFGARPMARAIADTVEQAVADTIIAGGIAPGAEIHLTSADLAAVAK
jgi:ATP-dependent Clp protease ATP-binding subunit ClpC